ncbi:hypothetical protein AB0467_28595 [Streptomyces sp. NPDC052095]|uniref:hypothetical protein n=1 Tax=unclassified Streptomyces TaxID=2593676 RepID=UPI003450E755
MSANQKAISEVDLLATLEAIDTHALDSVRARLHGIPDPDVKNLPPAARVAWEKAYGGDGNYSDLPTLVLKHIGEDRLVNDDTTKQNERSARAYPELREEQKMTKEQIMQSLKRDDDDALKVMSNRLETSRNLIAKELGSANSATKSHAEDGRAREGVIVVHDHWGSIIDAAGEIVDQTEDEIGSFFTGVVDKTESAFKSFFGL